MDLETSLLAFVRQASFKPCKPRQIARHLKLDSEQSRELKRIVKRLVKRGELAYGANHLVSLPLPAKAAAGQLVGVFRRMEGGFGFVRPRDTAASADRRSDIFINASDARDAATGDVVAVRLKRSKGSRRPNREGQIVEILERETHQFVGVYFESSGNGYVHIDGAMFTQPIFVGDPGAKNARPDDKVVVEMVRFPSHAHDGEGVITEVLGQRGKPGVDALSIIREFNLPEGFAEDTLEEARGAALSFDESIAADRRDLTGLTVITIDPVDARDFDDAISLERDDRGYWRLGVHIADVSHFVRPKSALDREAHQRGTSVYLPDRVLPMLPELISNGLASLQPDRVRYVKTVFIEFDPEGIPVSREPASAAIKSCRRFTYEEVDDYLANPREWAKKLAPEVHRLLAEMHELAMLLRRRRMRRGSLELNLQEVKIDLDRDGAVAGAHVVVNTESHQIIEEFMLAANETVAELLQEKETPFLRRVHHAPDPRKMQALTEFVSQLDLKTESLENRFALQSLLRAVAGAPTEQAVNYAVLRSLQRAVYSPEEEGHYALASDCYCHFTSPIRRYPDLTIHRQLDALIRRRKTTAQFGELVVLGDHCSDRERRAEAAERELTKVKLLDYLSTRIGEQYNAVITGVEEFGMFVRGIELPAEGLVHVSSLQDDFYRFERRSHTLTGTRSGKAFRLGDPVRVVVARVDTDRRELDFRLVGPAGRRGGSQKTSPAKKSGVSKSSATKKESRRGATPDSSGRKRSQGRRRKS